MVNKVWLLSVIAGPEWFGDYDTCEDIIVVAPNECTAREIAKKCTFYSEDKYSYDERLRCTSSGVSVSDVTVDQLRKAALDSDGKIGWLSSEHSSCVEIDLTKADEVHQSINWG